MNLVKADIGELYNYILKNAQLDEFAVVNKSATLGAVSFIEIDGITKQAVLPVIENMGDNVRDKAKFMLDASVLTLLRKRDIVDARQVVSIDVQFSTLMKTAFRTRYLVVLADFVKEFDGNVLLNIMSVPANINITRICDLLRYLIPILDKVSIELTAENILSQDLTKITAKYFVLTVEELTRINKSERRDLVLGRLAKLRDYHKEVIVRGVAERVAKPKPAKQQEDAFYL